MNCACISVGNAGRGAVFRFTAFGRVFIAMPMVPVLRVMAAPASVNLSSTASSVSARAWVRCDIAARRRDGHQIRAVSMRSGITACSAPCNAATPSTVMTSVPCPRIFAPILRHSARSTTSWLACRVFQTRSHRQLCKPPSSGSPRAGDGDGVHENLGTPSDAPTWQGCNHPRFQSWRPSLPTPDVQVDGTRNNGAAQPPGTTDNSFAKARTSGPSTGTEARMVSPFRRRDWIADVARR